MVSYNSGDNMIDKDKEKKQTEKKQQKQQNKRKETKNVEPKIKESNQKENELLNKNDNKKETIKKENNITDKKDKQNYFNRLENIISKKLKLDEQKFNLLELILLIIVSFIFGIFISEAFIYNDVKTDKFESNESLSEIEKVYNTILNEYYQDITQEELKKAAVNGMLNYLNDGYSVYFDEETREQFSEQVDGQYYGIGLEMSVGDDGYPYISRIFDNSPASDVDLKINDKIIKVEGQDVKDYKLTEISSLIKGQEKKQVNMTILRNQEELEKVLVTRKIDIPSVDYKIIENSGKKIGYIDISIFALNTDEQFKKALLKLEEDSIDSLIIDVRNNAGGHLSTVANILNLFFTKDEVLYQIDRKGVVEKAYGTSTDNRNYKVVVLTNHNSASGSEILASAFKEVKNSEIIGTKTFGKGTVQKLIELDNGSMLKITSETWLTSNGNKINKVGVSPTIEIELSEEYKKNPIEENDNQLNKAIEILSK